MTEQKVNSSSAGKPYHSELSAFWWLKHRYYLLYMLREATVLPLLFFLGCLMYGLYSLSQSEQHWLGFVAFMQQGWVIALNLLAFVASLFHAKTFFELFPRVMPLAPAALVVRRVRRGWRWPRWLSPVCRTMRRLWARSNRARA